MRLLLTRPEGDARPLARRLEALGHTVTIAPLLTIRPRADVQIADRPYEAVVLTSANAARSLGRAAIERLSQVPCFVVGPQSEQAARQAGFQRVEASGGDARGVADTIAKSIDPKRGPLLYLSGDAISIDLKARLGEAGFDVDRIVLYDAVEAEALPAAARRGIEEGTIDGVLLYSARTAKAWARCIAENELDPHMQSVVHFCLSPAIAAALPRTLRHRAADRADDAAMLELVTAAARERS
jgi:uroporphyrinogen-III synthase